VLFDYEFSGKLNGIITLERCMQNYHVWLLDLDDTLQIGPLSWASIHLFPDLIAQTGIKPEKAVFEAAYARANDAYRLGGDNDVVGDEFFRVIGWSPDLKADVIKRFASGYRPALFDETLPFLEWAVGRGDTLYVVTNNNVARPICKALGLMPYVRDVLTPRDCNVTGKPSTGLWDYLKANTGITENADVVMVGNHLTTDAAFARNCGLDCILVDRLDRFDALPERCFRVTSLGEIPLQLSRME
jgi:FMN phosphatase YigB (HAD superfamily)